MKTYRVEFRRRGVVTVVGYTDAVDARQGELSARAARMTFQGATGELVLVEQTSDKVVARRYLYSGAEWAGRLVAAS